MLSNISTVIVGLVFLVTGSVKALDSRRFTEHLFGLELLPPEIMVYLAFGFVGIECGLGFALVVHAFPKYLICSTILLLGCLSAITIWSYKTGKTQECGCYGGLALVTPEQSLLLNLGYILLLGLALYFPVENYQTALWKGIIACLLICVGTALAFRSEQTPIVNLSALLPGKPWRKRWLDGDAFNLVLGAYFIVFLGRDCPYCKQRIPALNVLNAQPHRPPVIGVMAIEAPEIEQFKRGLRIHFPILSMNKLLFSFLAEGVPTAVLVKDGKIETVEMGKMPQEYEREVQQFYRAIDARKSKRTAFFA